MRRREFLALLGCAASVVGQLYLTIYLGLMLAGVLGLAAVVTVLVNRGRLPWRELFRPGWKEAGRRTAVYALAAAAAVPVLRPHYLMAKELQKPPREFLARPKSGVRMRLIRRGPVAGRAPQNVATAVGG